MRSFVFTATSISLGVTAHVMAGGCGPDPRVLVFLTLVVWVCAQAAAGGERGGPALLAGVLLTQVAVHLALLSSASSMDMAGMHAMETPSMLLWHLLAGGAVAALLRGAEAGRWRLRRWLTRRRLRLLAQPIAAPARRAPRRSFTHHRRPLGLVLASSNARRGPPLPTA